MVPTSELCDTGLWDKSVIIEPLLYLNLPPADQGNTRAPPL